MKLTAPAPVHRRPVPHIVYNMIVREISDHFQLNEVSYYTHTNIPRCLSYLCRMHHLCHADAFFRIQIIFLRRRLIRFVRFVRSSRSQRSRALLRMQRCLLLWGHRVRTHQSKKPRREVIVLCQGMKGIFLVVWQPYVDPPSMQMCRSRGVDQVRIRIRT